MTFRSFLRNLSAPFRGFLGNVLTGSFNPVPKMNSLVAICVGHSRKINGHVEGGAVSVDGTKEWDYNRDLAHLVWLELRALGVNCFTEDIYHGNGYRDSMRWLGSYLQSRNAKLAVELHFNASSGGASGHEWLHWGSSEKSERLAHAVNDEFKLAFPAMKARGVKAKTSSDRGAEFLRLTKCPAIICEPFFGDNTEDWRIATEKKEEIAGAIARGIHKYLTV